MSIEVQYNSGGFVMKFNQLLVMLLAILAAASVVSAQEASVGQLKQMMEKSAGNLTTYTYIRSAESDIRYSNASLKTEFDAYKAIDGKVDLVNKAGSWSSKLTDEEKRQVLTWDGFFVNGSEYWKEGQNWTKFTINDTARIMQDYNEIPGQVNLMMFSNMKIVGSEKFQGQDSYKLVGSPIGSIYNGIVGLQLLAAYFPAPFQLPAKLKNRTLDINSTSLMNNSNIVLTAWVSKDKSLLERLDINSSLIITPKILNISSPDFRIESNINESTVYGNFGSPLKIELPKEAQNSSNRRMGMDWRWAVFGSVRP
jgi:hypothetical protein